MQLRGHALQHGAAFFFFHVQVAVAGNAKGGTAEHLISTEHAFRVGFNKLVEQQEAVLPAPEW